MSPLQRLRGRAREAGPEPGMVRAEDLTRVRRAEAGLDASPPAPEGLGGDPALASRRDRLAERLTLTQLELGGLFYEMAIRDSVQMDILLARAADLQAIDAELAHVDDLITTGRKSVGGVCASCQAPHARGAAFCWQCGSSLGSPEQPTAEIRPDVADA